MSYETDGFYEPTTPEENWSHEFHITKDSGSIELRLMHDSHLINLINLRKENHDVSCLENELIARDRIRNKS